MNGFFFEQNDPSATWRRVGRSIVVVTLAAVCTLCAADLSQPADDSSVPARNMVLPHTAIRPFLSLEDIARELGRVQAQGKGVLGLAPGHPYTENIGIIVLPTSESASAWISGAPLDFLAALLADRPDASGDEVISLKASERTLTPEACILPFSARTDDATGDVVFYTAAANEAARVLCTLPDWSPDWIARLHSLSNAAPRFNSYEKTILRLKASSRISPERAAGIAWMETQQYFRPSHVILKGGVSIRRRH